MYKGKFASELSMNELKEYYDELREKCPRTDEQWADFNILQEKLIVFAYKILDSKTNGDVIKAMFPNVIAFSNFSYNMHLQDDNGHGLGSLKVDWWDAPYKTESGNEG